MLSLGDLMVCFLLFTHQVILGGSRRGYKINLHAKKWLLELNLSFLREDFVLLQCVRVICGIFLLCNMFQVYL